jgi:ATP adenylyltransferase
VKTLWAPWRLSYVENPDSRKNCLFCENATLEGRDERRGALVLRVTENAVVIMNLFPYASGNLMVAPRDHTADLGGMAESAAAALMGELQLAVRVLERAYSPHGMNIGVNLGRSAGAGVADHLHWHLVPRWQGDTNFMPLIAETRVISQHLEEAYDRLLPLFEEMGARRGEVSA